MQTADDFLDRAVIATFPAVIKAFNMAADGRRVVEVAASTEMVDLDGDVVLQSALLGSANSFVAKGHLDLDHKSELGDRMGISDPLSYIVGRPLEVTAGPNKTTLVKGEISRALDGNSDPRNNRYDEFWASLQRDPPVVWFSSIYGFPTDIDDCTAKSCGTTGAKRWLIKSIDWRSLAFTRSPKNTALDSPARIVTAKSFMAEAMKARKLPPTVELPNTVEDAAQPCPNCEVHKAPSLLGYRHHFAICKGLPEGPSDLLAHACMHKHNMRRSMRIIGSPAGM